MMQPTGSADQPIRMCHKLPPESNADPVTLHPLSKFQATGVVDDLDLEKETAAENARWETLLATEESQRLLEHMADEAWAEIQAGLATPITFTNNGEIGPG